MLSSCVCVLVVRCAVPAAINLYSSNGAFKPHEDKEAITVLLNLSDQAEYGGGGTGFWSVVDSARGRSKHDPYESLGPHTWAPPTVVVRPPGGEALIFVGNVMHGGLRVTTGSRAVMVTSFSPMSDSGTEYSS